ncbi:MULTISPECIES: RecQ family ATP-dependent DNA helicase [Acidobacteriaceae]|uniref:RecQ family ATP-dependent DNA helicase n=1 Tax=Acidobacteriaceae TaxID=204434 RepID=UPI00131D3C77|nr:MULTISPECIES: RecQ family ATP-dependent DNA helicase [Acidobacteriaceae]MDW5266604.1 RecQ family ATP-dependent DNA helicase [Edaphobacter sp.]
MESESPDLAALLHRTFGFPAFRANQEAVCRAATDGRDVLLVMPTGAGKSLCYQLPAIARGGTALVISPLIALMDDQAAKLSALGLRVARIHSGLSREDSRQACRDYLDGTLQFLFIAPERMRVPGFPEMLAKKKPALIAIDEAHCISQWGHDFRPDYRTLGDYLPALRPAPVIALTATATPTVQKDIATQLQLHQPALFIHGFRRHNLAIEVVEMSKPRRKEFTADLLKSAANRPAIVYAPSRKAADELASALGKSAAAYHAGLEPSVRERVQRHFLSGELEVVVATIAFGMGIDKADVRTVVHIALPGSVEAYYQEIGRAGRDGLPSRTVLLHSYADRKMHDFFLERDYPAPTELARVANVLNDEYQMPDILRQRLKMDVESFNRTAEKLVSQGAAAFDIAGNIRSTGQTNWRSSYDTQLAFRRSQIDRMVAFAESPQCRMSALVQHFGDTADGLRPCGHCDFCSPERATAQTYRPPTSLEERQLRSILESLEGGSAKATGKLHTDLALGIDRKQFDGYLDALTRAGLIAITADTFTNSEGTLINFKRASLTHEGRTRDEGDDFNVLLKDITDQKPSKSRTPTTGKKLSGKAEKAEAIAAYTPAQKDLDQRLREWRKVEAAKTGKPAFMVFSDAILTAIVQESPTTISALLGISGIGPEKADRYGAAVVALCTSRPVPAEYGALDKPKPARSSQLQLKAGSPVTRISKKISTEEPVETFQRPRAVPAEPAESLTPAQQELDHQLREWRKVEAEKLGLPQFFVLGSSALRGIVLQRPQTLAQLKTISGIGAEKTERFGPAIIEVCKA